MLARERREHILKLINERGVVYLKELSNELDFSICTIRRDFEKLENENKCKRVHGGAVKVHHNDHLSQETDIHMGKREKMNVEEKRALCKKCADLIEDGDCVFVDGGTTFMFLMDYLQDKEITIVSHSDFIRQRDNVQYSVFILGGENNAKYRMNLGPLVSKYLSEFHFDKAFVSCAGFTIEDLNAYTAEIETAQVKQLAMENAKRTYLVIDSSKVGIYGFYNLLNLDSIFGLVTTTKNLAITTEANIYYTKD